MTDDPLRMKSALKGAMNCTRCMLECRKSASEMKPSVVRKICEMLCP
jgi:hypothetical protein